MQEIYFDKECNDKLLQGINKLAKAVTTTMGPNGRTVIIPSSEEYGKYIVTKDGVSVARAVTFDDPVENIGAQLVKEAAENTLRTVGDGTTTSTVLATALINNLKGFSGRMITECLDVITPLIIDELRKSSHKLKHEDIKYVATISANNDIQIGDIIQQAYNFSNIIKVEKSNLPKDEIEYINGMNIPVTYFSKQFITDSSKGECSLDEPYTLILDGKLDNLNNIGNVLNKIAESNGSILIITEAVHENALRLLTTNVLSGMIKACVIKSPGFASHRKDLLRDICDFTGSTFVHDLTKPVTMSMLGRLQSVKVGHNETTLIKHETIDVEDIIKSLKDFKSVMTLEEHDNDLLEQRIQNLEGKAAIIKVGGSSEIEMKERFDRYDDAVRAVRCALEEGIVKGGGVALYDAVQVVAKQLSNLDYDSVDLAVLQSLNEPITILGTPCEDDMFAKNIIDPLKVTRCALENAVSVAKTILTTDAVVLNKTEWRQ